jgi:hypothetical protein
VVLSYSLLTLAKLGGSVRFWNKTRNDTKRNQWKQYENNKILCPFISMDIEAQLGIDKSTIT